MTSCVGPRLWELGHGLRRVGSRMTRWIDIARKNRENLKAGLGAVRDFSATGTGEKDFSDSKDRRASADRSDRGTMANKGCPFVGLS